MKLSHLTLPLLALGAVSCSGPHAAQDSAVQQTSVSTASESQTEKIQGASPSSSAKVSKTAPAPQSLFDGSKKIFENKRYVALYGVPNSPSLGALGEQSPAESVERVKALTAQYQPYSQEKVQPAFELITTVASSAPGADGDYSDETPVVQLKPFLDEAEKNGVYVILDFQPGRSDFLSQIKNYEELLARPNVGVGFDPEWRLEPWQLHLEQVGSVDASEINESLDYLAQLVKEENLPQKMVVLHQFTHTMISNRDLLETDHPELALTLHADGHGTTELKTEGYQALLETLQPEIKPSWKNFYDEDTPMLTPAQTYALTPKPWVVTYQ